jgi:hypothetical protein
MGAHQPTGGGRPVPAAVNRVIADLKTLPRQFWLLAAGTLVYLIGVEMSYPYETLYING